jgi:hypothetical protein
MHPARDPLMSIKPSCSCEKMPQRSDENDAGRADSACPHLALFGHRTCTDECPLSGVKRTWCGLVSMSANDPKRTSARRGTGCFGTSCGWACPATVSANRWTGFCSNRQSMRLHTRCALLHYDYSIRWLTGDFSPCRQIQSWNLLPQRRYNDWTLSPAPRE